MKKKRITLKNFFHYPDLTAHQKNRFILLTPDQEEA
jgi:hypothetical protein